MTKSSLLSIIMTVYNYGQYLPSAITSVVNQTYKNWELIIIDDGSQDDSIEIATDYARRFPEQIKLHFHQNRSHRGILASYVLGFSLTKGEFIGFLEADDIWKETNAETKINTLLNKKVGMVYSGLELIGDQGVISSKMNNRKYWYSVPKGLPFNAIPYQLFANVVPTFSTVIIKSEVLQNINFTLPKKYEAWLDWFIWTQISFKTNFLFLPEELICWRMHQKSNNTKLTYGNSKIKVIALDFSFRSFLYKAIILPLRPSIFKRMSMLYILFVKRIIFDFFVFPKHNLKVITKR